MKGIKIEIEKEQPMYLYRPHDMVDAIAYAIYYTANPDSKMCVPNCAYEKAEKMFEEWREEMREKRSIKSIMYGTCKTCKYYGMRGSVKCEICNQSLTGTEYERKVEDSSDK